MTRIETTATIALKVGARRHETEHIARAISAEQRVYILHSVACAAAVGDLRECEYSLALDEGIDVAAWAGREDVSEVVMIDATSGRLKPKHRTGREAVVELVAALRIDLLPWQVHMLAQAWDVSVRFAAMRAS